MKKTKVRNDNSLRGYTKNKKLYRFVSVNTIFIKPATFYYIG